MSSDTVNSKCWPSDDIYFFIGASALCEKLKNNGRQREYYFLNVNGFTLQRFFSERPLRKNASHVIISSPQLMPLSYYWMEKYSSVCAVFVSSTSMHTVFSALNRLSDDDVLRRSRGYYPKISLKETILLQHYLATGDTDYIQNQYSRSNSTVLAWKAKLACKLNVRKLEHLLLRE